MNIYKEILITVASISLAALQSSVCVAQYSKADTLMAIYNNPADKQVLVAAHRGDWRNAPENSLQAISFCIEMGVDIAEIDVRPTKDGHLVLMHDKSVDRMTNGKGEIKDFTLEQLQSLFLKNAYGMPTRFKIPTLRDALLLAKGKIILFIDKGYENIPEIIADLIKTGTEHQVLLEGKKTLSETLSTYPDLKRLGIKYMPRVNNDDQVTELLTSPQKPEAIILAFQKEQNSVLQQLAAANKNSYRLMVNTLWPETCAGHDDDLAITDPDGSWGWAVKNGAGIICTDRPALLINYLRKKNLHQ
ncbi:glycerophosphodiester phosphodiesterase family protein [Desertivirga xinjiangensis]|uniref:glycerophosphodiester phosphodiesterase family protein n=1 Tax=Desertivirga xinjiangensis TaxID=539206 RepID=UPI00210C4A39|nr:glycerophosphodiester phosphodiesterase family protein [Pedobacter xinjiangensis]